MWRDHYPCGSLPSLIMGGHPYLLTNNQGQLQAKCLLNEKMNPHLLHFSLLLSSSPLGIFHLLFRFVQLLHWQPMLNRFFQKSPRPNETTFSCSLCTSPNIGFVWPFICWPCHPWRFSLKLYHKIINQYLLCLQKKLLVLQTLLI